MPVTSARFRLPEMQPVPLQPLPFTPGPPGPTITHAGEAYDRSYWAALERISGELPEAASRRTALRDNQQAFATRLDLVRNAQRSIVVTSYFFHPDRCSMRF